MPIAILSRRPSSHRKVLITLLGLLVVTATFQAVSATTQEVVPCQDDPDFVFKYKGQERDCDYIDTLSSNLQVKKICKKRDKTTKKKVNFSCPDACGECKKKEKSICPLDKPLDGTSCESKKKGLECFYDYEYTGGCGEEAPIPCYPISTLTCGDDKTWSLSTFVDTPCVGEIVGPVGESCDPTDCPLIEPEKNSSCDDPLVESTCGYGYHVTGPSPEDLTCSPSRTYTCNKRGKWKLGEILLSKDPEPCDPKEFCPSLPQEWGSSCELAPQNSCPYDYIYLGCTFESGISCIPLTTGLCTEHDGWQFITIFLDQCPDPEPGIPSGTCEPCPDEPPEENCPLEKPKAGTECDIEGDCSYDFELSGCSAEEIQCTSTNFFSCNDGVWEEAIADLIQCPPPGGAACPEEEPTGSECRFEGFAVGQTCEYDFRSVSCNEDSPLCRPTKFYTCTDGDGWQVAVLDTFCLEDPPGFYDECDPSDSEFCPLEEPKNESPCEYVGQSCDYDYQIVGCTLEDAACFPQRFYDCFDDGTWRLALPGGFFCEEEDPDVPSGPCDPDTFCPLVPPEDQAPCFDFGKSCGYDYITVGCSVEEATCSPSRFYECYDDGKWQLFLPKYFCEDEDPDVPFFESCDPDTFCPLVPPTTSECSNIGLKCEYGFSNLSCDEGEELCQPTEFHTCTDFGWLVSMVSVACENDEFPPGFGAACDP